MITSTSTSVAPAVEVARLTLISSSNEAAIRRKSNSGDIGLPSGDVLPIGLLDDSDPDTEDAKRKRATSGNDSKPPENREKESKTQKKDNNTNNKDTTAETSKAPEINDNESISKPEQPKAEATPAKAPEPPSRPPPPAPPDYSLEPTIQDQVEFGAQQDVTEVINNVLFQMQCAMAPSSIDVDGEQHDIITE